MLPHYDKKTLNPQPKTLGGFGVCGLDGSTVWGVGRALGSWVAVNETGVREAELQEVHVL